MAIFPAAVSGLDLCCALSDLSAEVVDFVVGGGIADVCEVVETCFDVVSGEKGRVGGRHDGELGS